MRNYYTYLWKSGKGLDKNKVLDDLPPYLKNKMCVILNSEIIKKVRQEGGARWEVPNPLGWYLTSRPGAMGRRGPGGCYSRLCVHSYFPFFLVTNGPFLAHSSLRLPLDIPVGGKGHHHRARAYPRAFDVPCGGGRVRPVGGGVDCGAWWIFLQVGCRVGGRFMSSMGVVYTHTSAPKMPADVSLIPWYGCV